VCVLIFHVNKESKLIRIGDTPKRVRGQVCSGVGGPTRLGPTAEKIFKFDVFRSSKNVLNSIVFEASQF